MLGQIHVRMIDHIHQVGGKISSIAYCPHAPDDNCECRKPKAGLYTELSQQLGISFSGIYSVGDSLRDLQAAHTAGAVPILVETGNGKQTAKEITKDPTLGLSETPIYENLLTFADSLLNEKSK
jgi:D-glycero-D-manno-heptose 1,7-bisphosphate phosphatase